LPNHNRRLAIARSRARSLTGPALFAPALLAALALADSAAAAPAKFYTVRPCRAVDTRQAPSPYGGPALAAGATRNFILAGICNTPPTASALALNVTVAAPSATGHLRLWAAGQPMPNTSTVNFVAGKVRANNAIITTGQGRDVAVFNGQATGTAQVIIDVFGYFDDPVNNQPPVVSAGLDQTITMPASATLTGSATDDGKPVGATLSYTWTKTSGPGTVSFTSPTALSTGASFNVGGTYTLRLSVSDTALTSYAEVRVRVDPTQADLRRFLEQASFGASPALVARVNAIGLSAWMDEQFALPWSPLPVMGWVPESQPESCTGTCARDNYSMYPLQRTFFYYALYGQDQLRQRVAWALHKLFVVSGRDITLPSRMGPYLQLFQKNAFGNYRTLLEDITLNPAMGDYLDMASSTRTRPNENYAREVLQIFSIGTDLLQPDGTPFRDPMGEPLPAYDEAVIAGFTKVFTGWSYAADPAPGIRNFFNPMILTASRHDTTAKSLLLGTVLPAGQTGQQDLAAGLDNIFNHPNVGPYIGGRLIRELVTSNPSPAYVGRVAAVFNDNGSGVRGDLGAVVKAVLFDPEARGTSMAGLDQGRLREPALYITGVLRGIGARSADGLALSDGHLNPQAVNLGQDVYRPGSVFSYYPAEFLVPGTPDVRGPEFALLSASTALRRANLVNTLVFSRINVSTDAPNGTSLDFTALDALAANPTALVDELDRRLMLGTMPGPMKTSIIQAVTAVPASNLRLRSQQATYLVCTSSQYQVQR
jgi:uncharacterized protein (DUF1800 family)